MAVKREDSNAGGGGDRGVGSGAASGDGATVCPRCGERFACAAAAGEPTCWCFERPAVAPDPAAGERCLCPRCLGEAAGEPSLASYSE